MKKASLKTRKEENHMASSSQKKITSQFASK